MVLKCCTASAACHAQIVRAKTSEANREEYTRLATALHNKRIVESPEDDVRPRFKSELTYNELKDHPNYMMGLDTTSVEPELELCKNCRADLGSSTDDNYKAEEVVEYFAPRLIGRRKTKKISPWEEML